MKKEVFDYFVDLNKLDIQKEQNAFLISDAKIKKYQQPYHMAINIDYYKFDSIPVFAKNWYGVQSVFEIASSKMYNQLGILTPPPHVMINPNNNKSPYSFVGYYYIITQDVHKVPNIYNATMPFHIHHFQRIHCSNKYNSSIEILCNKSLREQMLEFMSENCLNELSNLIIADELRTESDRHMRNLFLYKTTPNGKFDGVIAIDNEMGAIFCYNDLPFKLFVQNKYSSASIIGNTYHSSYPERIKTLYKLISNNQLSAEQIQLIKEELSFDFPKEIRNVCSDYNVKHRQYSNSLYDNTSYLWDFNRKTIGKELGM